MPVPLCGVCVRFLYGRRVQALAIDFVAKKMYLLFINAIHYNTITQTEYMQADSDSGVCYAVSAGRQPGIYRTWRACEQQVKHYKGAVFLKCASTDDAVAFLSAQTIRPKPVRRVAAAEAGLPRKFASAQPSVLSLFHQPPLGGSIDAFAAALPSTSQHVYTDGACKGNGTRHAVAGVGVYFGAGDRRNVCEAVRGDRQTNNVAELLAIVRALQVLAVREAATAQQAVVTIHSDSTYAINCCQAYGERAMQAGFPTSIPNVQLIKAAMTLLRSSPDSVTLKHVRAHTERSDAHSLGNAEADRLAKRACVLASAPAAARQQPDGALL
jgi:ribonuclease HI